MAGKDVAIIGTGMIQFGELFEQGIADMSQVVINKAIVEANLEKKDVKHLVVGTMSPGRFSGQEHIGAYVSAYSGLKCPAVRVEGACASGGLALRMGRMLVLSGYEPVVVCGVEKMTDLVKSGDVTTALGAASDAIWELGQGATFPSLYAMMAKAHMHEYGTTKEMLAACAVKNHENAFDNPYAQFHKKFTLDEVVNSRRVSPPLGILDCSPVSDGAAAVVLTSVEKAKQLKGDDYIRIIGSGNGTDSIALHERVHIPTTQAAINASTVAFKEAGIKPSDISLAEVHDCFTIAELIAIEDMGIYPKGKAGPATLAGETKIGGKVAINTSGGLKGKGHPVGATGVAQAIEMWYQLRGKAGKRQVKDPKYGVTHNVGGSGATCVVHVYAK